MKRSIFRTICSFAVTTALILTAAACSSQPAEPTENGDDTQQEQSVEGEQFKIGILQLMEHDALDNARNGLLDALAEGGYVDGEKIVVDLQNAQGDQSNLKTMSQKFVNDKEDLIDRKSVV